MRCSHTIGKDCSCHHFLSVDRVVIDRSIVRATVYCCLRSTVPLQHRLRCVTVVLNRWVPPVSGRTSHAARRADPFLLRRSELTLAAALAVVSIRNGYGIAVAIALVTHSGHSLVGLSAQCSLVVGTTGCTEWLNPCRDCCVAVPSACRSLPWPTWTTADSTRMRRSADRCACSTAPQRLQPKLRFRPALRVLPLQALQSQSSACAAVRRLRSRTRANNVRLPKTQSARTLTH